MLINDVILEIKNYKNSSVHKSALDIYKLLEGNREVFLKKMNPDNFNHLLMSFEKLCYENPKEYTTTGYQRDYQTQYDLFAEELRLAQMALSSITGEFTPDDLLGEIFGKFCIGK